MFKTAVKFALICLTVVPVNSMGQTVDIKELVAESQAEAQHAIREKIDANKKLVAEIINLENQLKEIKENADLKRDKMNTNLVIAAGTTLATTIAVVYLGRRNQSELGGAINYTLKTAALVVGSLFTIKNLGSGGMNYLLLQVDQDKIPLLEGKLAELRLELEAQTAALAK